MKWVCFWSVLITMALDTQAQKQLALIGSGRSVGNYPAGTYIHLILKDGRHVAGQIVELMEFSMITTGDTVAFNKIKKVGIPKGERKGFTTKLGYLALAAGVMYVGIDQINRALGYTTTEGEEQVAKTSAILVASGALLILIRPKYHRVNAGIFLRTVDYKSPFYKSLD